MSAPEQPMPTEGRQPVTPVARDLFNSMLTEREAKGIATYGTSLMTHNGRDASLDALEECIDLWQYLTQLRLEHADALAEVARLTAALARLDGHPTPTDQAGHCWYCGGGLGHGPHGHRPACPLALARKLVIEDANQEASGE